MDRKEKHFKTHAVLGDGRGGASQDGLSEAQRKEILIKQAGGAVCAGCGRSGLGADYLELGHDRPKAQDGGDHFDNRLLLCWVCHRLKRDSLTLALLQDRIYELAGSPGGKWHEWAMTSPLMAKERKPAAESAPQPDPELDQYRKYSPFVLGTFPPREIPAILKYIWGSPPPPPPPPAVEKASEKPLGRSLRAAQGRARKAAVHLGNEARTEQAMSKERDKDLFREYALNAATFGIYAVVGIWRDIQKQKAALRDQASQQAAAQPTDPQGEKSQ